MLAKFIIFDVCILHEHKFLINSRWHQLMEKLKFLLYNNLSYVTRLCIRSSTNSYKWSCKFSIPNSQLKYLLLFDRITISETLCILWRRSVCTIVSAEQRARSSFASLFFFFFSRVYLRDRIRKQPAFSFFYHEFPQPSPPVPPGSMEIQIEFELFAGIF